MNYNEMSSAQCADWLAEREQFERSQCGLWRSTITGIIVAHPFPLTLDDAAGALREPWEWDYIDWWEDGTEVGIINTETRKKKANLATDELTARYRAAVAARMEEER